MLKYLNALGSNTLISKNAFWPFSQKPLALISKRDSFAVLVDFRSNSSPVSGKSNGSDVTSLHTSDNIFEVKSRTLLWRILMNPPFLQFIACCRSNFVPQAQTVGKFKRFQPYRNRMPSQNSCLFKSKPWCFIGKTVNQFDTPFSVLLSLRWYA